MRDTNYQFKEQDRHELISSGKNFITHKSSLEMCKHFSVQDRCRTLVCTFRNENTWFCSIDTSNGCGGLCE